MEQETHETGRDDRVAYPHVPRNPLRLNPVELGHVSVGVQHTGVCVRERGGVRHVLAAERCARQQAQVMVVLAVAPEGPRLQGLLDDLFGREGPRLQLLI